MRIAQIVASLEVGGLERLAVNLAFEQQAAGHSPTIFCIARRGQLADEAERGGVPVIVLGKERGFSPRVVMTLANRLRDLRVDVVHTHNSLIHHYGALAAALASKRVVVNTQHGIGSLSTDHRLAQVFRLAMGLTSSVVFVSEKTRREYIASRGLPEHKTSVIRNGIPLARFRGFRACPGDRFPRIVFGTVGRLVPVKDHVGLVESFARVKMQLPAAELRIAGDGPLRQAIEVRARTLGVGPAVRLYGEISDVPRFLADLDVFVLSSITEGAPLAVLEAMAVGLPIVSSRVGGVSEVAPEGDVAEYCPPSDPQRLAEAMLHMSNPDRMSSMGNQAAELARNTVDLQHTWHSYECHFLELMEKFRRRVRIPACP